MGPLSFVIATAGETAIPRNRDCGAASQRRRTHGAHRMVGPIGHSAKAKPPGLAAPGGSTFFISHSLVASRSLPATAPVTAMMPTTMMSRRAVEALSMSAVPTVVIRPPPAPAVGIAHHTNLLDIGDTVRRYCRNRHRRCGRSKHTARQRGGSEHQFDRSHWSLPPKT